LNFERLMKKIIVFLFLLFSIKSWGQIPQLDSLKTVVKKLSAQPISVKRDSLLTVTIIRITGSITIRDLALLQTWTDSLNKFSKNSTWEQSKAYSHNANSTYYYYKGFTNLSFKEVELSVELFKNFHNEKMYANAFSKLVTIITNFLIIKPLSDEATEKKYLNYLLDGLALAKKPENRVNIANMNLCLMQYYIRHRNYRESEKCAINAWKVTEESPEDYFYYYHSGKASEGLSLLYLDKIREGFILLNHEKEICRKPRKEGDGSEKFLLGAIGVYLGNYYIEKKDYKNALVEAQTGLEALKILKVNTYEYLLNKIIYQAYKNLGKPVEALAYFEKVQAFEQEVQIKEATEKYIEWQLKYNDEKQKNQIQFLENQKLTQTRNVLSLVGLLSLGIIGYVFWNNRKLKKKNEEIQSALLQGQTTERKRMASELHDNISNKILGVKNASGNA
jgi:hypothetical protein